MQPDGAWTILIVSDDPETRASLIACFEVDYRARATVSCRDALSMQDTEEVDVVLTEQRVADFCRARRRLPHRCAGTHVERATRLRRQRRPAKAAGLLRHVSQ